MRVALILLFIISLFLIIGCADVTKPIVCTQEAKICPDGTAVGRIPPDCNFQECPSDFTKNYCTPEQKKADICIQLYNPVCGWLDPEKIQCIKYPCANTFSNSCFACIDENVLYWTEGECPK